MPITRYSPIAESRPLDTFIDTYVPIPFDDMMKIGMMKAQQSEQAYDALSKTYEDVYNLQYIPGSKDEKYIKGTVIPTAKEIFDKYSNQLSSPIIRRQMRTEFNTKIDKNRIRDIQSSYLGWKDYKKAEERLKQEGKWSPYQGDPTPEWDTNIHGVFSESPNAYNDPIRKVKEELFAPIHDSTLRTINLGEGNVEVISGVDRNTVNEVTRKNLPNYLNDPDVRTKIKEVREITGLNENELSDAKIVSDYIFKPAAEPFIRHNSRIEHLQRERVGRQTKPTPSIFSNISNTQKVKNTDRVDIDKDIVGFDISEADDPIKLMKSGIVDDKGNLKPRDPNAFTLSNLWKSAKETITSENQEEADKLARERVTKEYNINKGLVNHIRKTTPELANKSDLQIMTMYAKAHKNAENVDYNVYLYDTDPRHNVKKAMSSLIIDDIGGRKLISAQTGKDAGKPINTIDDVFDKLDVPKADRKKSNIEIIGAVPGVNAYKATVFASDGPHDFLISTNQREQYAFELVERANKLANNGKVGEKELNLGGRRYIVRSRLQPDSEGGAQFTSDIVSGDGKSIIPGTEYGLKEGLPLNVLEFESAKMLNAGQTEYSNTEQEDAEQY